MKTIKAYVCEVKSNRYADVSEKAIITANYQSANVHSTVTFDIPLDEARQYYVGQELEITVSLARIRQEASRGGE